MDGQIVYIVGKINPSNSREWEFEGVFSSQERAEKACLDRNYFIGPAVINRICEKVTVRWPDAYYPKRI